MWKALQLWLLITYFELTKNVHYPAWIFGLADMHPFLINALETCFFCMTGIFCVLLTVVAFFLYMFRAHVYIISDPDPVPNPGFVWQKFGKNLQL